MRIQSRVQLVSFAISASFFICGCVQLPLRDHSTAENKRTPDSTRIAMRKPNADQGRVEGLVQFSIQSEYSRRTILDFANVPEEALFRSEFPVGGFSLKPSLTAQGLGWRCFSVVLIEGSSVRSTNIVHRYWVENIPQTRSLSIDDILLMHQRSRPMTIEEIIREMETSEWILTFYYVPTFFVGMESPEGREIFHLCKELQPWNEALRSNIVSADIVPFRGSLEFLSWSVFVQMSNPRTASFFRKTCELLEIQINSSDFRQ